MRLQEAKVGRSVKKQRVQPVLHEFKKFGRKSPVRKEDGSWRRQRGQVEAFTSREHLLLFKGVAKRVREKERTEHPREEQDTKEEDPLGPREFITLEERNS